MSEPSLVEKKRRKFPLVEDDSMPTGSPVPQADFAQDPSALSRFLTPADPLSQEILRAQLMQSLDHNVSLNAHNARPLPGAGIPVNGAVRPGSSIRDDFSKYLKTKAQAGQGDTNVMRAMQIPPPQTTEEKFRKPDGIPTASQAMPSDEETDTLLGGNAQQKQLDNFDFNDPKNKQFQVDPKTSTTYAENGTTPPAGPAVGRDIHGGGMLNIDDRESLNNMIRNSAMRADQSLEYPQSLYASGLKATAAQHTNQYDLAKALTQSANQIGTIGGKQASSKPVEEMADSLSAKANNYADTQIQTDLEQRKLWQSQLGQLLNAKMLQDMDPARGASGRKFGTIAPGAAPFNLESGEVGKPNGHAPSNYSLFQEVDANGNTVNKAFDKKGFGKTQDLGKGTSNFAGAPFQMLNPEDNKVHTYSKDTKTGQLIDNGIAAPKPAAEAKPSMEFEKAAKEANPALSSRSNIAAVGRKVDSGKRLKTVFDSYQNLNNMPKEQVAIIVKDLDSLIGSGSSSTVSGVKELMPHNLALTGAGILSYAKSIPEPAKQEKFLKQFQMILNNEDATNYDILRGYQHDVMQSHPKMTPDEIQKFKGLYKLDDFNTGSKGQYVGKDQMEVVPPLVAASSAVNAPPKQDLQNLSDDQLRELIRKKRAGQ